LKGDLGPFRFGAAVKPRPGLADALFGGGRYPTSRRRSERVLESNTGFGKCEFRALLSASFITFTGKYLIPLAFSLFLRARLC
jgi:hypothetical protein